MKQIFRANMASLWECSRREKLEYSGPRILVDSRLMSDSLSKGDEETVICAVYLILKLE